MVDLNGNFKYSAIKTALLSKDIISIAINPNPIKDQALLFIESNTQGPANLEIANIHGQNIQSFSRLIQEGSNSINLDMKEIPNGVYFIKLNINNQEFIERIIKKK